MDSSTTSGCTSPRSTPSSPATTISDSDFSHLPPPASTSFVLVTGGLGYIGSHTSLELLKAGYNIIILDDLSNSFASTRHHIHALAAAHCAAHNRPVPLLHFHQASYHAPTTRALLEAYALPSGGSQISAVIHFAAYKSVSHSIRSPLSYYANNVCGLVSFLDVLSDLGVRTVIFSSSATVYGTKANAEKPLREDDVVHLAPGADAAPGEDASVAGLTCAYARTKFFCEGILSDLAATGDGWSATALRYFNPVGCHPSGLLGENPRTEPTNLFPVAGQVLEGKRERLTVFGSDWETRDGTAVRDYVHVMDVARGHVKALKRVGGEGFRVYNLGSGTGSSVLEIVRALEKASGKKVPVEWAGRRAGDVRFCVASNERAREELGWEPLEGVEGAAQDLWHFLQLNEEKGKRKGEEVEEGMKRQRVEIVAV
ncbi:UDP-glucose 4-epimerase [Podospora conica]|nr:UDP-glucose 4-epimerase [Schizothecium conicum]